MTAPRGWMTGIRVEDLVKFQSYRAKFRHAAPGRFGRVGRVPVVSAAVVVAALGAGILLGQAQDAVTGHSSAGGAVDVALTTGGDVPQDGLRSAASRAGREKSSSRQAAPGKAPKAAPPQAAGSAPAAASQSASASASPSTPPPSEKILKYDFQSQPNYYYCGPAATRIVLSTQGKTRSQDEVARLLHTTTGGTDSAEDATRALNSVVGDNVYQTRPMGGDATPQKMDQLQADVVRAISNDRGVVANVVGSVTDQAGNWHGYGGGHYVAIVGYRDEGRAVKIADPATFNSDGYWVGTIAMARWMVNRGYSY
jgi:Peptidase_C39 like family